jgi:hypothetical protein
MESLYLPDGDRFVSTELTRGPWSPLHQHGGPPSALMARELERRLAGDAGGAPFHPARMTVELLRPVPIAPLEIAVETLRPGRKVRELAATCTAGGEVVARARVLFIRRAEVDARVGHGGGAPRSVADSPPYRFTFFTAPAGYHTAMELRRAEGAWGTGAMTAWMRLVVPVVPGEAPSPLQRVVVAADSGNGISAALDPSRFTFLNPDLTVYLHRVPAGEWVCLAATTTVSPGGVGLAECALSDEEGPIGRSLQSLLVEPR